MTGFPEIKAAVDQTAKAFSTFSEESKKRFDEQQDRLEALEASASHPKKTANADSAEFEHQRRFTAWLRSPNDPKKNMDLREIESRIGMEDRQAITIGTPSDGGYAVPMEIAREIEKLELRFSPVRRLVKGSRQGRATTTRWPASAARAPAGPPRAGRAA